MHIGFIAHNFVRGNGQGRINLETARYAARQGHRVTLLAAQVDDELAAEPNIDWQIIRQTPKRPQLVGGWRATIAADRRLRDLRHQFDVVVGAGSTLTEPHDVNLCQFVHAAWIKSPVHVARTARGPWAWYQWAYTRCNVRWERQAYKVAEVVVAPSHKIRDELLALGLPSNRIAVIYNGVDLNEFYPQKTEIADAAERQALGIPTTGLIALFVGDIRTTRKNLDNVLKAVQQLPAVHLVVAGATDQSPFPQMARELKIVDRVTFLGFRRDIGRLMRASDLFVFPSRYEAGTLVLTEAAACGLPLVTAVTAGGCEVFGSDVAEVIDDPDDLPALVGAIRRFSESSDARRSAAVAARNVAMKLTWTHMAQQYLELFEAATARRAEQRDAAPSSIAALEHA